MEPIPAETPGINLAPSAALFDAVNRGDLAAAREAMGRGADLNARNQLGLTPIDAAVDQGRNEIAFYLLSARGSAGSGPTFAPGEPAPAATRRDRRGREVPAPRAPAAPPAGEEDAPPSRAAGPLSEPPRAGRASPASAAVPVRARLFAGDGGGPRPEIGFLGFDAGRPAGAEPLPESRAQPPRFLTRRPARASRRAFRHALPDAPSGARFLTRLPARGDQAGPCRSRRTSPTMGRRVNVSRKAAPISRVIVRFHSRSSAMSVVGSSGRIGSATTVTV